MATEFQPLVGEWYQTATGDVFEVVAIDSDEQTIEIQYFDGAVEELDLDTWQDTSMAPAEAPEDWSGSMDVTREDFTFDVEARPQHDGYNYLDSVDNLS